MRSAHALASTVLAFSVSLAGCTTAGHASDASSSLYDQEVSAGLEEITVTRTTRTQYTQGATPACAGAPFQPVSEQHYDTWSIGLRSSDARIVSTHENRVGEFMACFSGLNPNGTLSMYAKGTAGAVSYTSVGECKFMQSKPPAPKLLVLNCNGDLSQLPADYIGGYLTASSLAPAGGKDAANVPGYLSTSVITMRLWRKPRL